MARERKPLKRLSKTREVERFFIIATEGLNPEISYFKSLNQLIDKKIHIELIYPHNNKSAPKYVLEKAKNFTKEYHLRTRDELWIVIDRDRWDVQQLSDVASRIKNVKKYVISFAMSNPSFEFWLLLHVKNMDEYTKEEKKALLENKNTSHDRNYIQRELVKVCGQYNKKNLQFSFFKSKINQAITQAKKLDSMTSRWPTGLGSHVYKLVEKLL